MIKNLTIKYNIDLNKYNPQINNIKRNPDGTFKVFKKGDDKSNNYYIISFKTN